EGDPGRACGTAGRTECRPAHAGHDVAQWRHLAAAAASAARGMVRAARVAMRRTVFPVAMFLATAPVFAGTWTDLWLTPDQQGQRMLDAGDASGAAKQFQDPRLRAYADAKAGNYDSAVEQLAPMKDAESLYNRGNALARAGKLQEALGA